eukprot:6109967-Prymnesium_polylepis.1
MTTWAAVSIEQVQLLFKSLCVTAHLARCRALVEYGERRIENVFALGQSDANRHAVRLSLDVLER